MPKINWGSFRGRREEKWGSFQGRHHFGVDLGIISGLGIIPGSGSFRGLYRTKRAKPDLTEIWSAKYYSCIQTFQLEPHLSTSELNANHKLPDITQVLLTTVPRKAGSTYRSSTTRVRPSHVE